MQELRKNKRRPAKAERQGLFSGLLYCADCGGKLHFATCKSFEGKQDHYVCSKYKSGRGDCSAHYIREDVLREPVLERIQAVNAYILSDVEGFQEEWRHYRRADQERDIREDQKRMEQAKLLAGDEPIMRLVPVKPRKYGLVTTGNEVFYGRIEDTFSPVVQAKLAEFGCEMAAHVILNDDHEKITAAINDMLAQGCEMVLCTGGMSVDPDDKTPLAIKNTGANIVSYGAPVLPGAMFLVSYSPDGRPVCGLPGCVMYAKRTIFDLVLPYLVTDTPITKQWLAGLGSGGLCLNCPVCHFPNCGFGKGR